MQKIEAHCLNLENPRSVGRKSTALSHMDNGMSLSHVGEVKSGLNTGIKDLIPNFCGVAREGVGGGRRELFSIMKLSYTARFLFSSLF
jgi:hypothetical protein